MVLKLFAVRNAAYKIWGIMRALGQHRACGRHPHIHHAQISHGVGLAQTPKRRTESASENIPPS